MRGKRAKTERAELRFKLGDAFAHAPKVRPGRKHGGPALGKFEYPPSIRLTGEDKVPVLQLDPEFLRAQVRRADAGIR